MIYVTGDTHGIFTRVDEFCRTNKTTKDDILIILGDAGINSNSARMDMYKKEYLLEVFYVGPYYNATLALFYEELKLYDIKPHVKNTAIAILNYLK